MSCDMLNYAICSSELEIYVLTALIDVIEGTREGVEAGPIQVLHICGQHLCRPWQCKGK